jgi:uncharacterized protein YjiS (DUF1127 family)
MLHTYESVGGRYSDTMNRAHDERAKVASALLAGAATGLGTLAGTAARGLGRAGRNIVSGVVTARRRRAAIRELRALDHRMLKDIGISRGEIPYLVDQMLSAERAATEGPTEHGQIATFRDRKATDPSTGQSLRHAA